MLYRYYVITSFRIPSFRFPAREFLGNEVGLLAFLGILSDEIGEKEQFENNEDNKKLDTDDEPERSTQRHLSETVVIKVEGTAPKAFLGHRSEGVKC